MKNKTFYLYGSLCLFSYFVVIGTFISMPEEQFLNISLSIFSLVATSLYILMYRSYFRDYYNSPYFKKLVNHLVSIFLIVIILGLLNYLAYKNPIMHDFSKRRYNSLTKQSTQILQKISGDLRLKVFTDKNNFALFKQLTELYRLQRPETQVDFIDATLRADLVQKYEVLKVPAIVVEYYEQRGESVHEKRKIIQDFSEQALTSAIAYVSRKQNSVLYFTKGHGELDLEAQTNEGGHRFAALLAGRNYTLKTFSLAEAQRLPDDISALVIWGPRSGFFDQEIKLIDDYFKQGGKIVFALDPNFKEDKLKSLRRWLEDKGLLLENNLVIDKKKFVNGSQGTIPFIHSFNDTHPINKEKPEQVFFPLVSGLTLNKDSALSDDWSMIAFSGPHPDAWGETNVKELVSFKMKYDEGRDVRGPLGYSAAWENPEKSNARMLAFGNSTFVSNTYHKFTSNGLFALNSLGWLLGEQELITFDVPEIKDKPIFFGKNQLGVIFYFSVVFAPLCLFLLALVLFKRRQKL